MLNKNLLSKIMLLCVTGSTITVLGGVFRSQSPSVSFDEVFARFRPVVDQEQSRAATATQYEGKQREESNKRFREALEMSRSGDTSSIKRASRDALGERDRLKYEKELEDWRLRAHDDAIKGTTHVPVVITTSSQIQPAASIAPQVPTTLFGRLAARASAFKLAIGNYFKRKLFGTDQSTIALPGLSH